MGTRVEDGDECQGDSEREGEGPVVAVQQILGAEGGDADGGHLSEDSETMQQVVDQHPVHEVGETGPRYPQCRETGSERHEAAGVRVVAQAVAELNEAGDEDQVIEELEPTDFSLVTVNGQVDRGRVKEPRAHRCQAFVERSSCLVLRVQALRVTGLRLSVLRVYQWLRI